MTDEQIIKALECCVTDDGDDCFQCPYGDIVYKPGNGGCVNRCHKDALDLINLQKIKNEEELRTAKSEAIKEFAELLKRKIWHSGWCNLERTITPEIITNLVKEMTEVQK